jgi:hypothetical protein
VQNATPPGGISAGAAHVRVDDFWSGQDDATKYMVGGTPDPDTQSAVELTVLIVAADNTLWVAVTKLEDPFGEITDLNAGHSTIYVRILEPAA